MTDTERAISFFENALENCVMVARKPFETALAALRRIVEDDKAREEGLLVRLPCKPNETFLHHNYDTGALELNIALHDFDGKTNELPWEEIDQCAYWE